MAQVGSDRWADQNQWPLEAVKGNHVSRFRSSKDVKILKSLCKYQQKVPKYLWWAWLCMLLPLAELGNLGKSHQAQVNHVFNFILEILRRRKAAFPLKPGARLCPLTLLSIQLLPCPHRHPCVKSMSCPQPREAKKLPKSHKFIKNRFPSGQETAVILLPWSEEPPPHLHSHHLPPLLSAHQYFTWIL